MKGEPASASPEPPDQVLGRFVRLRSVTPEDYPWLYALASSDEHVGRWRYRGALPRPEVFVEQLWADVHAQMIVESRNGAAIGLVTAYGADPRNGVVRVALILESGAKRKGWPLEGAMLFFDHLFRHWPIRKVYIEGPDVVMEQIGLGRSLSDTFVLEARLRSHERIDGGHVDHLIYGLFAEDFYSAFAPRLERMTHQ